ncbi:MAG: prepilin peptidase [Deltaproteobacteria bacterium]|nr:prepilin peptidase [Deltaproteobacteria bacterium]
MTFILCLAVAVTLVAAAIDLKRGEIPNWLTFGTFIAGVLASAMLAGIRTAGDPLAIAYATGGAIAGSAACAVLPFLLWRSGVMGGGDVKLFIGLGALCHAAVGLDIELTAFIAGSLVAPVQLAFQGKLGVTMKRVGVLLWNLCVPKAYRRELPQSEMTWYRFGPAIALAAVWVAWSRWGQS